MQNLQNTVIDSLALTTALAISGITPVFDLDGVAVDARHRQCTLADGTLNLAAYRENSTPEKIALDAELPLLKSMQDLTAKGVPFYVCTARVACESTRKWLTDRGVKPTEIFSRDNENDHRRDYQLKTDKLSAAFSKAERLSMMLIDDNLANCNAALALGMSAVHVPFNGH